jgi:acyl-CoA dehydrogenase
MDFTFSEEQEAVRELATRMFSERATHERLKEIETAAGADGDGPGPIDRELWSELGKAGLLGIHLGEDVGGAGLDFVAACLVIEAAGRTAAYVPVVESMVYGAVPIAAFGTAAQKAAWLPGAASGSTILTAALAELAGEVIVPGGAAPATTATVGAGAGADGSWVLNGVKACVPAAFVADAVLVPAMRLAADGSEIGTGVFIVDVSAAGVSLTRMTTTTGRPEAMLELSGVAVGADRLLGGDDADGAAIVALTSEYAITALCIQEAGACAAAMDLTAEYTKTRVQFEKPIATFQAVGQRAADAYVDTEAIRLTAWQAASRLAAGLPAASEVAVAKFWAAEGGQRVVHAAAHLHGGVGVDRDYPLHRYFLLTRQIELTLGSASDSLRRLGRILAAEPV